MSPNDEWIKLLKDPPSLEVWQTVKSKTELVSTKERKIAWEEFYVRANRKKCPRVACFLGVVDRKS